MKKLLLASAASALVATSAMAGSHSEVKIGIILGYTGPIESLVANMGPGAELAMAEVSESGALLGGAKVRPVIGFSTCVDAGAATAAADRLITSEGVMGIVGGYC